MDSPLTSPAPPRQPIPKDADDASDSKLSMFRKCLIIFSAAWTTLAVTFSSTSLVSVIAEVANDFHVDKEIISVINAGMIMVMGTSTFLWGPIELFLGRKITFNICTLVFILFTIAEGFAPNIASFAALRVLCGLQGTYFPVAGQAILAENFAPTQRGTATGVFLFGTVIGPPLGPCIASLLVEHTNWRSVLWLQAAMSASGLIVSLLAIPRTPPRKDLSGMEKLRSFNPIRTLKFLLEIDILLPNVACGLLSWSMYTLLSSPRSVLRNSFGISSPTTTTLYYLPIIFGFLIGTVVGGRISDYTVEVWIKKRNGLRLATDRLRGGFVFFFGVIPVSYLILGWCSEYRAGGLAVPLVFEAIVACGILAAFAGLNTYCAESRPKNRVQVIATKYLVQYVPGAAATLSTDTLIQRIGPGRTCTIAVASALLAGMILFTISVFGERIQSLGRRRDEKRPTEVAVQIDVEQAKV